MILDIHQNTPEWHELRKNKIGASDSPIICGISPWSTPLKLWETKKGLRENFVNDSMKRGIALEDKARRNIHCYQKPLLPAVVQSKIYPWMIASIDAMDKNGQIIEIKCPGKSSHDSWMRNGVPKHYLYQIQHQMFVCEVESCGFFSYCEDHSSSVGFFTIIARDESIINEIIEKGSEFFNCLQTYEMPIDSENDYADLSNNSEFAQYEKHLSELMMKKKYIEQEEEIARKKLIEISNNENVKGNIFKLKKIHRKGSIDYSKVEELNGIDLEKYRSQSSSYYKIARV
jgi:putative phage-type endonuclease